MTTKDRAREVVRRARPATAFEPFNTKDQLLVADAASEVWIEQVNDCIQKRIAEVSGWTVSLTQDQRVDIMDWLVKLRNEIVTGTP